MEREKVNIREDYQETSYHKGLQKLEAEHDHSLWPDVSKLLERKSHHVSQDFDPNLRIEITRLSATHSTSSLARSIGMKPSTAIKIVKETCAGITYILGKENEYLSYESLDIHGKEQYEIFDSIERKRKQIKKMVLQTDVNELVLANHSLSLMVEHMLNDGAITPLITKLGIPEILNVNSYTNSFLLEGRENGGTATLMRKILYADWLKNFQPVHSKFFLNISFVKDNAKNLGSHKTRNFIHFYNYLSLYDYKSLKKNPFLSKEDFLMFDALGEIDISEKYFNLGLSSRLNSSLQAFVSSYIMNSSRDVLVEDISHHLDIKPNSARKVYDCGLIVADSILLDRPFELNSPIVNDFRKYVKLVKEK